MRVNILFFTITTVVFILQNAILGNEVLNFIAYLWYEEREFNYL